MAELTLETLMVELQKLERRDSPDGYSTMSEIIDATKQGRDKIARMVRALVHSGAMEYAAVQRKSISGVMQKVPGYRLAAKKEAADGKAKAGRISR